MSRLQANFLLLLAGAIWGAGFIAQSTAMATLGPIWFIGLRFAVATLVAVPFALVESRRATAPVRSADRIGFIVTGVALFAAAAFQQVGLLTTSVTNSGFLTGLYVVFTPILTVFVLRKRAHWIIWPAALTATAGIFLLSGGAFSALTTGDVLTIVCALLWSIQMICVGVFAGRSGRPLALSLVQFAVCAVVGCAVAAIVEPISLAAIRGALPEILYSGLFSSGLAFICQNVAQRYTTAPQAAIFLSSEALFAAFFGVFLLGETIPAAGYAGCAIIFVAMLATELVPELSKPKDRSAAA
ncbi:DMT family transporter [Mycoplana dimorpha]|uniref:EamA-like transporter family protein n=1 Tax=Mycoplana dimorpha TaxID=28320 RepID=A0A2T5B0W8_MYCDI|nr:DMT family transporter [Mycoplana dimorpha]PTM92633.1 EamA-like transporter family protein [Mycoplana dimorpha]